MAERAIADGTDKDKRPRREAGGEGARRSQSEGCETEARALYPISALLVTFVAFKATPLATPLLFARPSKRRQIEAGRSSFQTSPRWRRSLVVERCYRNLNLGEIFAF